MKQGWEIKSLGEIGKPSMCKRILKNQTSSTGEIPFYKIGTFGKTPDAFISKKIYDEFRTKYSFPKNGDILISASGTIGRRVRYDGEPAFFQDSNIVWIDNDEKQVLNDYLYVFYEFCEWQPSKGATIARLYNSNLTSIKIAFPKSLSEQQRIVAILDTAFAAIAKAKANAAQNVKNAKELFESYLQGVFETKGEGWVNRRLGESDLIEIIDGDRGKNYPTVKDFTDEGFCLFMNTKNVRPDGFMFNTTMFINEAKDQAMGKGKLKRNDVVMTTRGTIGNLGVYNEEVEFDNIRINSGMLIFRPNLNQITSEYLFEILRSGIIKEQIRKQVTGAAQPQLPIKTLVNFIFPVPKSLKEQQTIVQKLDTLSAETKKLEAIYQQKINDLEELKKSVLQKAFSGELNEIIVK